MTAWLTGALVPLLVLLGLLVLVLGRRPRGVAGAWALVLAAVVWVLVNKPLEGPVLVRIADDRGFTTADTLSVLAVALAALRLRPAQPPRSRLRESGTLVQDSRSK